MTQNSTPSTGETATHSTAEASYPLISVATVPTERAARYGKQLVSHMGHKITGSWNEEAAAIGEAAGLNVVMDKCVKIEHARFHGGLHLAGFNTGVISAKRQVLSK